MKITLGSPQYTKFSYPAKEIQVRLDATTELMLRSLKPKQEVHVIAQDLNSERVMELALLKDAIKGVSPDNPTRLILPYLPYSRADWRFVAGDCLGLATFGKIIFSMGFDSILTLDAHSDAAGMYVPYLKDVSPEPLISLAINRFCRDRDAHRINILYPDEGAAKRYKLPQAHGCNTFLAEATFLNCHKKRNPATGEMMGFEVPDIGEFADGPILIVDDICDGGATFIGIAKALKDKGNEFPLGLYVTHGIFSKGVTCLWEFFTVLYTSNSFTHMVPGVERMDCLKMLL